MKKPSKKGRLHDMHFAGYDFTAGPSGTEIRRETIDPRREGDYGSDPLGDGTFRMVPSGDIVSFEERNRRLKRPGRNGGKIVRAHLDADARDFRAIDRDAADVRRRVKALQRRDHPGSGAGQILFGAVLGAGAMHLSMKEREKAGRASGKSAYEDIALTPEDVVGIIEGQYNPPFLFRVVGPTSLSPSVQVVFALVPKGAPELDAINAQTQAMISISSPEWDRTHSGAAAGPAMSVTAKQFRGTPGFFRTVTGSPGKIIRLILEKVDAAWRTPKTGVGRSAGDDPPRRGDIQRGDIVELPSTIPWKWPHTARVMRIRRGFATLETGMSRYELPVDTLRRAVPTPRPGDKR
jgi:hypothetical protein